MEASGSRDIIGAGSVEMADLSHLIGRNVPLLITFALAPDLPAPASHYVLAFVRMTDRAAYAYSRAREALSAAAGSTAANEIPIPALMRGADYLDLALNAIVRAHLLAGRLRRDPSAPEIERAEVLSEADFRRVRKMRHFAEHVDQRIRAGEVGEGGISGLALRTRSNGIEFAGETLTYAEVGEWITRLDGLARRLLSAPPK